MSAIFTDWKDHHARLWDRHPVRLTHPLDQSPLFTHEALIDLISHYPREHYSVIHMGAGDDRFWKEGEFANLDGQAMYDAVAAGRLWLNLRRTDAVDPRYRELLRDMFEEIETRTGQSDLRMPSIGILISSPNAQVYYHSDLPNQSLWQIRGRKKIWLYPNTEPFLSGEDLERIAIFEKEVDLAYEPWYDDHALTFDLEPGQMLHWPLNAPHRVQNADCVNVSMTSEYWARDARSSHVVNMANGTLRYRFGLAPTGRARTGPAFLAKRALNTVTQRTGWLDKVRAAKKPIEFTVEDDKNIRPAQQTAAE